MATTAEVLAAIATWRARPLDYQSADCARFAAHVVAELTGRDWLASAPWSNQREADAHAERLGGLVSAVTHTLGLPPAPRGDLVPGAPVCWQLRHTEGLGVALDHGCTRAAVLNWYGSVTELPGRFVVAGWHPWAA